MIAVAGSEERARAGQDGVLARYLRREVMPYSRLHRSELQAATISSTAQLDRIPARRLADVDDPGLCVLRPDSDSIQMSGDVALIARLWWAQLLRRQPAFNRAVLEPVFKPVHWLLSDGVPLGYTAEDMERLAEIGRACLEKAGLTRADSIVTVEPSTASLPFWQTVLGARRAGITAVHADPEADVDGGELVARLAPTIVSGPARLVIDVARRSPRLRAVIATDGPHDVDTTAALESVSRIVIAGWAAPSARAMWVTCVGGTFHTWPATEIVERDLDGELVWTPLQWKGSVLLRSRTGQHGDVTVGRCQGCGRVSPTIRPAHPVPSATAPTPRAARRRTTKK